MHEILCSIMLQSSSVDFHPNLSVSCFRSSKRELLQIKSSSGVRWHPLIIKGVCISTICLVEGMVWCSLKIRCLTSPSQRTLRDYTHFADACTGFSHEIDEQLIAAGSLQEWKKKVKLLLDEMYIREDLEYDKFSGSPILTHL
jgi:hypothetical protein